jgi:tRNA dimethylallyltransferase
LAAQLAHALGGEVISADSRQVYQGLDIGAGKDLGEYVVEGRAVPYHLVDNASLEEEYSLFHYQRDCYGAIEAVRKRGRMPILAGGTGLYLQAVLSGYVLAEVPENAELRAELAEVSDLKLEARLRALKPDLHNTTDVETRDRMIRAIEIAAHGEATAVATAPPIHPLILGTRWPREELRQRIRARLVERVEGGLIAEVEGLLKAGRPPDRLRDLGREYRYVNEFREGDINNVNDLVQKLSGAIAQFAKRQDTWFRRMERKGHVIHWVDEGAFSEAMKCIHKLNVPPPEVP